MIPLRTYSLEWLDSLISVTLNPERPYLDNLQPEDIARLQEKIPTECIQVQSELNNHIFGVNKESQVQHMVKKYYNAIISLRETMNGNLGNPGLRNPDLVVIEQLLLSSLNDLLSFIEKRYGYYIDPGNGHMQSQDRASVPAKRKDAATKVLCNLSGDQIALILRGADEAQILKARSMNAVFKSIVPFLSTEHRENLSADSIRSKAYNPEEADRDMAVKALEAIIRKIQSY